LKISQIDSGVDFLQHGKFLVNDIYCYLVYRPPNGSVANMTKLTELISQAGKNSILIGDFNLPGVCWETGTCRPIERAVVEAIEDRLMVQMVYFATHTKGNILDLVVTNMPERVLDIREEGRLGKSDHSLIMIEINVTASKTTSYETRLDWKNADWGKMHQLLSNQDWKTEVKRADTERGWELLKEKIEQVTMECVPERRKRNVNRPRLSQEILRAIRKKKRLWSKCKDEVNKEEYKQQEKITRNLICNAKRRFERKLADGGGQNKKPFYAYVKT
jgi:Endonuclease-reverse transcriptase